MEIKSHLFEKMQFCFLHAILFYYFSAEIYFSHKKNVRIPGFLMRFHISM